MGYIKDMKNVASKVYSVRQGVSVSLVGERAGQQGCQVVVKNSSDMDDDVVQAMVEANLNERLVLKARTAAASGTIISSYVRA